MSPAGICAWTLLLIQKYLKPWAELSLTSEHAHWATLESAIDPEKPVVTLSTFFLLFAQQKEKGILALIPGSVRKCMSLLPSQEDVWWVK